MSADNGIYILKTPCIDSFEYRVSHAQAIENLYWENGKKCDFVTDEGMRSIFDEAPIFKQEKHAWDWAISQSKKYPILEYGVSLIESKRPFPVTSRHNILAITFGNEDKMESSDLLWFSTPQEAAAVLRKIADNIDKFKSSKHYRASDESVYLDKHL